MICILLKELTRTCIYRDNGTFIVLHHMFEITLHDEDSDRFQKIPLFGHKNILPLYWFTRQTFFGQTRSWKPTICLFSSQFQYACP